MIFLFLTGGLMVALGVYAVADANTSTETLTGMVEFCSGAIVVTICSCAVYIRDVIRHAHAEHMHIITTRKG